MSIISDLLKTNDLIHETKNNIKEVYLMDKIPWVIGYSGGKDSTTTTQLVIETIIEMKRDGIKLNKPVFVISSDTLVETPMIINTIKKTLQGINKLAIDLDLPLKSEVVKPKFDQTFWVNIIGRGYPTPNQTFRWCTDRMKIDPANRFIKDVIDQHGEAIMVLGVRDGESISRDRVIESHHVQGKKLMRHGSMVNAFVFAPIRKFTIDDVWQYLLANESPWGSDNRELYKLYSDSSSECPLVIDETIKKEAGSCGNSRFGCWTCPVVKEDKSLTGFIKSGEEWLRPMLEYRNWLTSIRDDISIRMKRRTNGSLYFSKIIHVKEGVLLIPEKGGREKINIRFINDQWIDDQNNVWNVFEGIESENEAKEYIAKNKINLDSGENPRIIIKSINDDYMQLGSGPFTFETRKLILKKLLLVQKNLEKEYELIKVEEINEIRKIWMMIGDWEDSAAAIYREVFGNDIPKFVAYSSYFDNDDMIYLGKLCQEKDFDFNTLHEMLRLSQENYGFSNRKDSLKEIDALLNKEFLLFEAKGNE